MLIRHVWPRVLSAVPQVGSTLPMFMIMINGICYIAHGQHFVHSGSVQVR